MTTVLPKTRFSTRKILEDQVFSQVLSRKKVETCRRLVAAQDPVKNLVSEMVEVMKSRRYLSNRQRDALKRNVNNWFTSLFV